MIMALFNLAESGGIWDAAIKIATPLNLAAYALAVVLFIVLKSHRRRISPAVWIVIVLLVAIPIGASVYGEIVARTSIYRLRVTVVGTQGVPFKEGKDEKDEMAGVEVWSSLGGEPKRVAGGWQIDIPNAGKPRDGKLTVYASKKSDFLTGKTDVTLNDDFNLAITVDLLRDDSARVRGQVTDGRNRAVEGARVLVVGYETEAVITKEGGNFELPAHAAIGQQVLLHAEKKGYRAMKQYHQAGDEPVILTLNR
jgi:hypothetical protein